jgi:putative ABC transport system substrate-binding protein
LAAELVQLKPDVIVAGAFRPGQAAAQATSTIPVVLVTCDPYQYIVDSLARPGGNVTGQTSLSSEMSPKKLGFLKRAAPTISHAAFLYNPDDPGPSLALKLCQAAAPSLGLTLVPFTIQRPSEISDVLARSSGVQVDALFVYPDSVTGRVRARTAEFASQQRLPTVAIDDAILVEAHNDPEDDLRQDRTGAGARAVAPAERSTLPTGDRSKETAFVYDPPSLATAA